MKKVLRRLPGVTPRWTRVRTRRPTAPGRETRTGLDHMSFGVAERDDLASWVAWLDECGVAHSGVVDATDPVPYSVVVLRDPDHIQLELMYMGGGRRSPLDADVLCPGSGGVSQRRRAAQAAIR